MATAPRKRNPCRDGGFIRRARARKVDECCRRCSPHPGRLAETIADKKQVHPPSPPANLGPLEISKEYTGVSGQDLHEIEYLREVCGYAALEIQCNPQIRRSYKRFLMDFGSLQTQPTAKGNKVLDLLHPSYRVKRLSVKISDLLSDPDVFLDVLQQEKEGLISFKLDAIEQQLSAEGKQFGNSFFHNLYTFMCSTNDKWNLLVREVIDIIRGTQGSKAISKTLQS